MAARTGVTFPQARPVVASVVKNDRARVRRAAAAAVAVLAMVAGLAGCGAGEGRISCRMAGRYPPGARPPRSLT
ncbi:hypothetical protein CLM82_32990 [Streptomyces albidoflavus]|nr:hypothetical protein CLM82_32990 [Streptomyces albidoflavus]